MRVLNFQSGNEEPEIGDETSSAKWKDPSELSMNPFRSLKADNG
jgi:hypothetical protein